MKRLCFIFVITMAAFSSFSQAKSPVKTMCDKQNTEITYSMHHPLHSWTGTSKDVISVILSDENKKNITQVAVSVKVSSFDSQNANRDSHMIEVTEAIKYPNITFASTSIKQEGNKLNVTGNLVFHGITQIIEFTASVEQLTNKSEVTGNFPVKMSQFKIEAPSLMGMSTDDDIKINFKAVY
jgi:polyisoprenoid-binding protein YceI